MKIRNRYLTMSLVFLVAILAAAGCGTDNIDSYGASGGPAPGGGGGTSNSVPTTISILPDSNSILVSSNTFVRATVRDQIGIGMSGVTVTFTITSGSGSLNPVSGSAVTDAQGQASIEFTATATPGPVGIEASVSSVTPALTSNITTISVTTGAAADPASIAVSANPLTVDVGGSSSIVVIVRDSAGNLLSGKDVDFTFDAGSTLGNLSAATATTNSSGQASVTFTAGTSPGTVVIRATATGFPAVTQTASVLINSLPATISVSVANTIISMLSSTTITAYVLNNAGQIVSDGTVVDFTCGDTLGGTLTSSSTTSLGYATATYVAGTRPGVVSISVSSSVGTAQVVPVQITIQQPTIGSIQYVSADPNIIGISSAGQNVTSTVTFAVKTTTGLKAPDGTRVQFTMTGPNGGEYIGDPDATPTIHESSSSDGTVSVIVNSGDVAGPVRITATVLDTATGTPTNVTTATSAVSIGGGFPSARHFSMATTVFNLPGLAWYGKEATLSVYVADRFGNYNVMPATTVSFYIEAGAVDASNVTNDVGVTTSIVRTQGPEPDDVEPASWEIADGFVQTIARPGYPEPVTYNPRDGWVRVIAVTRGEEKFIDLNANGLYDTGEPFDDLGEPYIDANNNGVRDDVSETFTDSNGNGKYDRGETFVDTNGNGVRDEPEFYVDTNKNGSWDGPNSAWDSDINIWTGMDLVFTGTPIINFTIPRYDVCASTNEPFIDYNGNGVGDAGEPFSDVNKNGTWDAVSTAPPCQSFTMSIHDINMNSITGDSSFVITTTAGDLSAGTVEATIPDGFSYGPYFMDLEICDSWLPIGDSELDAGPQSGGVKVDLDWNILGQSLNIQKTLPGTAY